VLHGHRFLPILKNSVQGENWAFPSCGRRAEKAGQKRPSAVRALGGRREGRDGDIAKRIEREPDSKTKAYVYMMARCTRRKDNS